VDLARQGQSPATFKTWSDIEEANWASRKAGSR